MIFALFALANAAVFFALSLILLNYGRYLGLRRQRFERQARGQPRGISTFIQAEQERLRSEPVLIDIGRRWNERSKKSEPAGHYTGWNDTRRVFGDRSYRRIVYIGFMAR